MPLKEFETVCRGVRGAYIAIFERFREVSGGFSRVEGESLGVPKGFMISFTYMTREMSKVYDE